MRKLKDSGIGWLGEIPSEWETGIINWVADEVNVAPFNKDGLSYIGMENVEASTSRIIGELDDAANYSSSIKFFDSETILLGKLRPYLAKTAFPESKGVCSSEFITLKAKQINPQYLVRLLACYKLSDRFSSNSTGVKMPRTNWLQIKKFGCPIPPIEEQELIADYLDKTCEKVDLAIKAAERSIEEYKAYKQSVIFEAVTKGLDLNVPMKNSGIRWIGEIPAKWTIDRMASLFNERKAKVSDQEYQPLSVTKQGIIPQLETVAKSDDHSNRKLVYAGDFVINSRSDRRNSCGFSELNGSVSLINIVLQPAIPIWNKYFDHLFDSVQFADELYSFGHGIVADLWTTNWVDMKKIILPVPSLDEQRQIADYLDKRCAQIDLAIASKQSIIEELKAYKKSLIYEVVTGKREIDDC